MELHELTENNSFVGDARHLEVWAMAAGAGADDLTDDRSQELREILKVGIYSRHLIS